MPDAVSSVKSAINPSKVLSILLTVIAGAAVLELLGWSSLLIQPVAFLKGKFGGSSSN